MIGKALSGELGFREYLEKVEGYCSDNLDSGYVGDYKDEVECIEAAKAVYALTLNEALSQYGQDIGTEQVVIENLANILIYTYVADSTLTRVLQNKDLYAKKDEVVAGLCAQVYTAEEGMRVMEYASKIFNNIFDGDVPDDIEVKLNTLRSRLSLKSNTIGMKKIIGEKTIQADGYTIKNS